MTAPGLREITAEGLSIPEIGVGSPSFVLYASIAQLAEQLIISRLRVQVLLEAPAWEDCIRELGVATWLNTK